MDDIDAETLRASLSYDASSGLFTWRNKKNGQRGDRRAGYQGTDGYIHIRLNRVLYRAHRLAWLYQTGEWPTKLIDHANGDRGDNTWKNLREATHADNLHNSGLKKNNKSGFKGVCWHGIRRKWRARIAVDRRIIELGMFDTAEAASVAYDAAARKYHGEFFVRD